MLIGLLLHRMKKDAASRSSLVLPSTSARPAVVLGAPIPSSATASSGALAPAADKPLPHELKMMHRFLGNNTSNLKVQVQQVVKRATDGEALLAAMKDLVELVGLVIYDCYNLASVQVGDRRVQASLLRHAEVIESAFRHVLATAKVLATQLASNAPGEQIQSLKEQLESTVAVLAGHLDKLVSQNSDADAKVSSVEEAALSSEPRIIKDTRVVSAAESIQRANQSLDVKQHFHLLYFLKEKIYLRRRWKPCRSPISTAKSIRLMSTRSSIWDRPQWRPLFPASKD